MSARTSNGEPTRLVRVRRRRRARNLAAIPFLDDKTMNNACLDCSGKNFGEPRLQRCTYDLSSVEFIGRVNSTPKSLRSNAELDGGLDGYNWKIRFRGDSVPFAMCVRTFTKHTEFWDVQAPNPPHYFAAQRECQNSALFQMLQAAVSKKRF